MGRSFSPALQKAHRVPLCVSIPSLDKVLDVDMDWVPDQGEKAYLREEFTSRMYQCFLDGKDRDFNYK